MNREKAAWTISAALLGLLAFQLPGTLAQREEDYAFVRTLVDIHRQVSGNWVEPVSRDKLREGAIEGLLGQLDPFSVYIPPEQQEDFDRMLDGSFKGVGIQLNQLQNGQVEVVTPIEGSPAFKAGVKAGDIIIKVNNEGIEGLRLPDVIKKVAGKIGTEVSLTVRHVGGEEVTLKMLRDEIVVPTIKGFARKLDDNWDWYVSENPKIAYLRITQFTPETFDRFKDVLVGTPGMPGKPRTVGLMDDGMKGLILDLRFNPGGRLDQAIAMIDLLIDHGVIVSTKGRNRPENVVMARKEGTLPNFPMIVLVNEHSASASEIVAGSLMDNKRALVMGTRSYGKGSVQELIPLDGKSGELKLTVAYYYLPSGRLVHRKKDATDWGVQPQIIVPMDASAEEAALRRRMEQEQYRRPVVKSQTQPTTEPAAAVDTQLQRAVDTMTGLVVLSDSTPPSPRLRASINAPEAPASDAPATVPTGAVAPEPSPTTAPATNPAIESDPIPASLPVIPASLPALPTSLPALPASFPASLPVLPASLPATAPTTTPAP